MDRGALRRAVHDRTPSIAIDGPAGAGKSTVGRGLAEALDCPYLDTGLMYRAVTLRALQQEVALSDARRLREIAQSLRFRLENGSQSGLVVDDERAGGELRTPQVDAAVSEVSAHPEVRQVMVARQREMASGRSVVMVGRDIGTVVLPDAPVKLWVTASEEERARRRQAEHLAASIETPEQVLAEIRARDRHDSGRSVSPLRQAPDAAVIETDKLTPEEALERALDVVSSYLSGSVTRS
jgi:cytidylate kinase